MKLVKINWAPVECVCDECICQTEVSFREQGNPNWYTPTSPNNPTQNLNYEILIREGVLYQVKLIFRGPLCQESMTQFSLLYPETACCPAGYTASPDTTYCYKIQDVAATPPSGAVLNLVAVSAAAYSTCGSYIYNTGYALDGTGTATQIPLSNGFWKNGAGACADATTTEGPLNRTGVWTSVTSSDQDIGFGICLNLPEAKTYYIGIAADNYGIVKVDNITIIQQNPTALGTQYGVGPAATFKVWHIYPVHLAAGPHIIELRGHNDTSVAALGCEIYNATKAELEAATSYIALGEKLIFSSKNEVGQPAQLGTANSAYTCPTGYSIAACATPVVCRKILTTATVPC